GKVLGGFALIVAVLIGGYFGKELSRMAQDWLQAYRGQSPTAPSTPAAPTAAVPPEVDKMLAERIAEGLEAMRATLPKKVDDATTMVSATNEGSKVTFGYKLGIDGSRLTDEVKAKVREVATKEMCAETLSRQILDLGGSFRLVYTDVNEQPVITVDVVKS